MSAIWNFGCEDSIHFSCSLKVGFDGLDDRERSIVQGHYGLGSRAKTLREIGENLHLSVERVRQIEERALGKLREAAIWPSESCPP